MNRPTISKLCKLDLRRMIRFSNLAYAYKYYSYCRTQAFLDNELAKSVVSARLASVVYKFTKPHMISFVYWFLKQLSKISWNVFFY